MAETSLTINNLPRDPKTGMTLPLSRSLDLQALACHKAMVAFELEVMAKKMDRFGWERDRNSMTHNRLVTDWMDALQDYTLDEVKAACREWVRVKPDKMPNEGNVLQLIRQERRRQIERHKHNLPPDPAPAKVLMTPEEHAALMAKYHKPMASRPINED